MKERAILIDLDGTLVNNEQRALAHLNRRKKNLNSTEIRWDEFFEKTIEFDQPNQWCMEIVENFSKAGYKIVFLTGRMDTKTTGEATRKWLQMYLNPNISYELIMRKEDDFRKNHQIKLELLMNYILPKYDILFSIDDILANVEMFRTLGIPSMHCSDLGGH